MSEDTISMRCPSCQSALRVPASFAGKTARCRKCQASFAIPANKSSPASPPPQAKVSAPPAPAVPTPAPAKSAKQVPPAANPPVKAPVPVAAPPITAAAPPASGYKRKSKTPAGAWVALAFMSVITLVTAAAASYLYLPGLTGGHGADGQESVVADATDDSGAEGKKEIGRAHV